MDLFEHKLFVLHLNGECLSLQTIAPTSTHEHDELCRLEEKGLVKFLVIDSSSSYLFQKSFVQKIVRTMLSADSTEFEIADQSKNSRKILQIKASNISVLDVRCSSEKHEQLMCEGSNRLDSVKERCLSFLGKLKLSKFPIISGVICKG